MIQPIYIAERKCGNKWYPMDDEPVTLLRTNYLSEFRTEIEKAQARKNLGIPDEQTFSTLLDEATRALQSKIDNNSAGINTLRQSVNSDMSKLQNTLGGEIDSLEQDLTDLNNTITPLKDSVDDLSSEVGGYSDTISTLETNCATIQETVNKQQSTLDSIKNSIDISIGYDTDLGDDVVMTNAVGGIKAGTKVSDLRGKTLIDIVDIMLFPSTVGVLLQPTLSYSPSSLLLKVGSVFSKPTLTFTRNHAGQETDRVEVLTFNGSVIDEPDSFSELGVYQFKGTVSYDEGEPLVDSHGNPTDKYVPAGSKTATSTYTTTYPWYIDNSEQKLIAMNTSSGELSLSLIGAVSIKLPGANSSINRFTVDAGLGFMDVNLDSWTQSTETINGITYKIWTKTDAYQTQMPHKINFTLEL